MSVIKVRKLDPGYAQIPNSFARDERLSEAALAVGLFLQTCPDGTKICPTDIQELFSQRPGKPRGREWWARVAGELKSARYLWLSRTHRNDGKFSSDWIFCITGIPDEYFDGGSAAVGSPASGSDAGGTTASGSDSTYIKEEVVDKKTTTTTTARKQEALRDSEKNRGGSEFIEGQMQGVLGSLIFEKNISALRDDLLKILKQAESVDPISFQDLLDELSGALEAGARGERQAVVVPLKWFRRLIEKAAQGEFDRTFCKATQRRRMDRIAAAERAGAIGGGPEQPRLLAEVGRQRLLELKAVLAGRANE